MSRSDKTDGSPWISYRAARDAACDRELRFDELREEFTDDEPARGWLCRESELAALSAHLQHFLEQVCPARVTELVERIDGWLADGRTPEEALFRLAALRDGRSGETISAAEFATGCAYLARLGDRCEEPALDEG